MGIHGGGWASQILIYPWPLGVSNVWTNPKKQIQKRSYLLCMVI